jgi:hypothetical protein
VRNEDVLKKLAGGDRRSIGRANEVVEDVMGNPSLFGAVFDGILDDDPVIRMRAADVVEKVTAQRPELLERHKTRLIFEVARIDQQEVCWHVAQMLPRLALNQEERAEAITILFDYLSHTSKIVQVFSMQGLTDFARSDVGLRPRVIAMLGEAAGTGSPAVQNRARKLLEELRQSGPAE